MDTLKQDLEQRQKPELIAIIQHMLRQEPQLQWLLTTPLPTSSSRKPSVDPAVYRQQVFAAMSAGDEKNDRPSQVGCGMPSLTKRPGAAAKNTKHCWQL